MRLCVSVDGVLVCFSLSLQAHTSRSAEMMPPTSEYSMPLLPPGAPLFMTPPPPLMGPVRRLGCQQTFHEEGMGARASSLCI